MRIEVLSTLDISGALKRARAVPVIRTKTTYAAETVISWLTDAGFRIFEITMTVPDAEALIRSLSSDKELLVGAGTVPNADVARSCCDAGARFIVAPWVDTSLSEVCRKSRALLMLGAVTPTEVRAARAAGADVVKIFPATSAGGSEHIKSLCSVFPGLAFCPTGGVSADNLDHYLEAGAAFVGVGGAVTNEERISAGDRSAVQELGRRVLHSN